jgi:hypothetical protein
MVSRRDVPSGGLHVVVNATLLELWKLLEHRELRALDPEHKLHRGAAVPAFAKSGIPSKLGPCGVLHQFGRVDELRAAGAVECGGRGDLDRLVA